ncbi:hypothetical protein BN946_scf184977.g150 [Trametes cinnabarina]|uniref:Major facilitator superfamily (MFS) profile domain-containing protein n=1 Tax=Pycnoporus cinnabarinus TaxID=5643 RepID=A0A060SJQ4_PYCCI|nr:hypothetical protein BN946_scf184977.g150 [Trametes cinnabarina]
MAFSTAEEPFIVAYSKSRSRFYTMLCASVLHAIFFIIMGTKSGFPSMMVAYVISAFARSFISAVGGFAAPLVCQSIVATGIRWANFYYGSLVLSAVNISFILYAFWPIEAELRTDAELAWKLLSATSDASDAPSSEAVEPQSPSSAGGTAPVLGKASVLGPRSTHHSCCMKGEANQQSDWSAYKAALTHLQTWTSALFALIYTGSESATQGFIVVYLLAVRNANPNTVGYVTSGFWGGMALSRFIWGYLGSFITFRRRKWIVQACIVFPVIAFAMNLLILLVPSFIENAISTAVIGTVYGPIFPANLASARDLLPAELHMVSLAIM